MINYYLPHAFIGEKKSPSFGTRLTTAGVAGTRLTVTRNPQGRNSLRKFKSFTKSYPIHSPLWVSYDHSRSDNSTTLLRQVVAWSHETHRGESIGFCEGFKLS